MRRVGANWEPTSPPTPTDAEEQWGKEWEDNMCDACVYLLGLSDMCRYVRASTASTPAGNERIASTAPPLSFDGKPGSSPSGSPFRGSVYGIVTPSSRGSPSVRPRSEGSDGQRSAPPSKQETPMTSHDAPPRKDAPTNARTGSPRRCPGGNSRVPRRVFTTNPTQQEYAVDVARDAYYRRPLWQLGKSNAGRNVRRNVNGRYHGAHPTHLPLSEVREEDMARGSTYTGKQSLSESRSCAKGG